MKDGNDVHASVAFTRRGGSFRASAPLSDLALLRNDPAQTMREVTDTYERALREIRVWQLEVETLRKSRVPLSAKKAWELGNIVFRLNADLAVHGCRLEKPYDHLKRHANLSPKWLTQYVTLRRCIDDVDTIPSDIRWNSIMKSVKAGVQSIAEGLPIES